VPIDDVKRRKMSIAQNKFEDIFQTAKTSEDAMDILIQNLESLIVVSATNSH
jgi:4-hydroxy-3-methylbut-2-enyl diphosphate reductase IspH